MFLIRVFLLTNLMFIPRVWIQLLLSRAVSDASFVFDREIVRPGVRLLTHLSKELVTAVHVQHDVVVISLKYHSSMLPILPLLITVVMVKT